MSTVQGGQGNIVTNGLVLNLDAANPRSYPQPYDGTTWQNVVTTNNSVFGSLINGVAYTGSNGGTLVFDGVDDFTQLSVLPYQLLTTGFTISITFKYTQTTNNDNLIAWGNSAFNATLSYSWEIRIRGNGLVEFSPGVFTTGSAPVRLSYQPNPVLNNRIANIDVVYNANSIAYIYENANLKNTYDYTGVGLYPNTQSLRIGRGTDTCFPGNIYSTRLYNRALNPSEILQNFNATRARFGI